MLNSVQQDTPSIKSSDKLSEIDNQSLPPTDNKPEDAEMGELSEAEVRSISLSIDKENYDSINNCLEQDKEDMQDAPYKIMQTAKNKFKKIQRQNQEAKPIRNYDRDNREDFKKPENKRQLKREKYNQGFTQRTQKKECLDTPLTIQEGNVLIESWKENHFIDFNSWVQIAKSDLITEYKENQSLESENRPDGYSCSMRLKFNKQRHGDLNDFVGNGFGKSKKGAKIQALERLVTDLVQTGLIRLGLRDRKFWYKYQQKVRDEKAKQQVLKFAQPSAATKQKEKENIALQESKTKIAKKAQHKMQGLIRDNKFSEALDQLEIILQNKQVEWKELNFIWAHAMKEQNLVLIKQIIQKISFNRHKKGAFATHETEDEDNMSSAQYVRKHHADKVKQKLFQFYGLTRLPSENQYEYYDSYVLDINDPDIRPQQIQAIPEDEQEKQIVQDPFARNMKDTLVNPPADEMAFDNSPMKEIDQKNLHFPGVQIKDPFQSLQESKSREQKVQKSQQERIYENIAQLVTEPESLRDIQDMESEKVITQGEDDFVVYRKKPDIKAQFVERELVDELYESLIYSGDLNFSLNISELIYSELVIKESEFLHQHASEFYMQKKNAIITQQLDKIYDVFSYNRPRGPQEYLCTLNGTLIKLGCCHSYDSLLMTPQETTEALESKLLKKCKVDVRDTQHKVIEGDVVVLTTFFQPSYEKPILKEQTSRLANYINTKAKNTREQSHFIHSITEFGNTVEYAFIATIREIQVDKKIRIILPINDKVQEAFNQSDNRTWKITKLAPRFESNKIDESLIEFCTNPKAINNTLFHVLLTPPTQSSDLIRKFSETTVEGDSLDYFKHKTSLNNAQAKAVKTAATQMLTLIQGPPGSGKTTCCIEIVIEWLRQSGKPVLLTAENDQNVDVLFNELMKANIKAVKLAPGFEEVAETHFQAQRQRTSDKIQQKKQRLELQQEIFQDEVKNLDNEKFDEDIIVEQQEHYKQRDFMIKRIEEENGKIQSTPTNQKFMFLKRLLREAPVVVCKASSVGSDYLKGLTFFRVVVDEAHRVSETLALSAVVKNCQKLVLIGDPMSPGVKVTSMFAASKGHYLSLFDKFVMQRVQPIILTEQYKLHPSLINFPSFYFYKNKIGSQFQEEEEEKAAATPNNNTTNSNFGFKWPDLTIKNAFVYVKGTESLVNNGIQNLKEIEVIIEIMMQMLQGQFIKTNQILILTSTEEQKRRIRNEITYQAKRFSQLFGLTIDEIYRINKHSLLIDVDTLDRAQFYDKDLVIFSPVRTNKHEGLGILRDPRILNSLLWCGRKGLITVGDLETLQQDTNWAEYIRWCKKNKLIQYYISK